MKLADAESRTRGRSTRHTEKEKHPGCAAGENSHQAASGSSENAAGSGHGKKTFGEQI